ncbi:putative polysaccharide biosynthesis protein [Caldisalinibacter kiritimatiensis]|uniref:Stage V sporulation protein B n=1 Tax=Caldisalinibacter kiritimatiensis TaxID=1304284 RepID=R1CSL5_9FIRM|nr:polysaccharide biosynthesis protein [Caldisalinibacter kiritimatiensis]EOD01651.1 Stage V sporulation protein B [Caldisalinibacter kiritimatiensis]
MKKTSFIYGSIILASVNFIVRLFGFIYKIILSKLIGPEGIGLFQMVFPILMVFITLTTAGIPIAVSKLVSKQNSLNNQTGVKQVFKLAFSITFIISILLVSIIILFKDFIVFDLLKNSDLYYSILFLAPAIFIISISSVTRGYFYGLKKIKPAGLSQIIEQVTRIVFVIGTIYYLYPVESKLGALIAVCGISIGEFFGLIWLLFQYKIINRKNITANIRKLNTIKLLSQITYISVPITISRMINVSLQMVNAVLIPQRLTAAGYSSSEAVSTFGRVVGMSFPLIFLPFIVTSALVINIIPNLSEQLALKKYRLIREDIELSIRITLLISIPLTIFYIFFSEPIASFIYNDIKVGKYMSILGYATIFLSLQHTLSGILHGLGKQIVATINYVLGMSVQLLATYFLVANPKFGINGFFIGFISSTIIISFLNLYYIDKILKVKIKINNYILKPLLSSLLMISTILICYKYLNKNNMIEFLSLLIPTSLGGIVYIFSLILIKGLPKDIIKRLLGNI